MSATAADISPRPIMPAVEDSVAGWFLLVSALLELVFNRVFAAMGIYVGVGEQGVLSALSELGYFAMNGTAIMGLILACILLPKLAAEVHLGPLPSRILLMLSSPLYLPVICVAIFRPISPQLVLVAYLVSVGSILYLTGLVAFTGAPGSHRRLLAALALVHLFAASDLLLGGYVPTIAHRAHLFAETLYLISPLFALVFVFKRNLAALVRRPHLAGLAMALAAVAVAGALLAATADKPEITVILAAFRALGIKLVMPGGPYIYLLSLFIGALVVGTLVLPSRRWPPTAVSRKIGFGLACIWSAGMQPTHPYQAILVVTGFLYVTRGILDNDIARRASVSATRHEQNLTPVAH